MYQIFMAEQRTHYLLHSFCFTAYQVILAEKSFSIELLDHLNQNNEETRPGIFHQQKNIPLFYQ